MTPCIIKIDSSVKVRKLPPSCCFLLYWLYLLFFSFSVPVKNILFFLHHYCAFKRYKTEQEKKKRPLCSWRKQLYGSSSFCFTSTASRQLLKPTQEKSQQGIRGKTRHEPYFISYSPRSPATPG